MNREIVKRAEARLARPVPEWVTLDGKDFRKYIAKALGGGTDLQSEKLASEFLVSIGVEQILWPYSWRNPDLGKNVCVLDDRKIKIVCVHRVELDAKQQVISKSEKEVTL